MSVRRPLVILFLASTAAFSPAPAAATWSAPLDVSSPATSIAHPFVGFGRDGSGIVLWDWQNGIVREARSGTRAAAISATGAFGPERPAPEAAGTPVVYGSDHVVVAGEAMSFRRERPPLARVQATFGRTDGSFGRTRTIDTVRGTFRLPAVAANDAGDVALAYVAFTNHSARRVVKLALRRHGGRFGRPRIVSGPRANSVAVAIGKRGDLVVAWERGGRVEARISRAGHRLGPVVRVGRTAKLGTSIRAAVAPGGRVWLAWSSQMLSEGGDNGPFTLQVAVTRGGRFERPHLLDQYAQRASDEATFDLALDPNGNGFVAWSTYLAPEFRASLVTADRSGRFSPSKVISPAGYGAVVTDLVAGYRAGEALVVWSRLDQVGEVGTNVLALYRPPSGGLLGQELVSSGDGAREGAAAFNPRTNLPTVVWSQRSGEIFVRASTRLR
jgi:hypothetical protein